MGPRRYVQPASPLLSFGRRASAALEAPKRYAPALVLLLLSPAVGELLSGSTPPLAAIFNPIGAIFLLFLYGGGAIITRELALRWHKGWPSILVMGAAYGIVEEGLMCKSFFNPDWPDAKLLGSYGRMDGVNWVWAQELVIFHAVFSITIPILLVSLMYPERRNTPWAGPRLLAALGIAMAFVVVIGYFGLVPYPVPIVLILLSIVATLALLALAYRLPHPLFTPQNIKAPKARWFFAVGLIWSTAFFLINWAVPRTGIDPPMTILIDASSVALYAYAVFRMSGAGGAWKGPHMLALAAGTLGFLIAFGVVKVIAGVPGISLVCAGFALGLALLYRAVVRRESAVAGKPDSAGYRYEQNAYLEEPGTLSEKHGPPKK